MITSKKHFETFRGECLRLIKEWGLDGFEVRFEHKKMEGANAKICVDISSYNATMGLNTEIDFGDFKDTVSESQFIKKLAKHETLHLLLGRLSEYGSSRYVTRDEVTEAEEELVRKLLKIIK